MKTMKLFWRMVMYRPWLYLLNMILWAIIEVFPLLPTLIVKAIFDHFSLNTGLSDGFWWLIAAIVGVYFGRIAFTYAGTSSYVFYSFSVNGLLRQNMLKAIFKQPGAQALSISPSEALNRFRDDVHGFEDFLGLPMDVFGKLLCALVAVGILLTVNARITLVVFLPLFAV